MIRTHKIARGPVYNRQFATLMSALTNVADRAISAEADLSDQQSQMLFTRKQHPDVIMIHRSSCCSLNPSPVLIFIETVVHS